MLKNNPLKLKKYDNPDAVAYGRAIKLIQKESAKMLEKKLTSAEKDKKEDIIMSLKKQKGGKDKLKPADYAIATSKAKKVAETADPDGSTDTSKMETLLGSILSAIRAVDKSQDDTEDDVEELDQSIDYLASALTDKDPIDIAVDQAQFGRLAKPVKETGMAKAKKNMDMYKDKNRLTELIKAALMGPISEKKQRPDYPDIDGDGDTKEPMVKAAKDKEKAEANESFDSLVKKVDKAKGYTKKEAEKVAGAIAAKKRAGAGKGPTAKQKKRMAETILKELRG